MGRASSSLSSSKGRFWSSLKSKKSETFNFNFDFNFLLQQVIPGMFCGYGFYNGNGSPPWRPDDKDGHYVFAIGENLTPRCKSPLKFPYLICFDSI
jgi:hypothetical protein